MRIQQQNRINKTLIFLIILLNISQIFSFEMIQHGDLKVKGDFSCENLIGKAEQSDLSKVKLNEVSSTNVTSAVTQGNVLITDSISSLNKDGNILITSLLKINGEITYNNEKINNKEKPEQTSFIELSNIYIDGIKQWKNIKFYSENKSLRDLNKELNSFICKRDKKNIFESSLELNLVNPEFDIYHYKVELLYEFVNKYWNKNLAYIKVDDDFYWNDNHDWDNLAPEDEVDSTFWQSPITFIIPARFVKEEKIKLTFGFKLNKINDNFCKDYLSKEEEKDVYAFKFSQLSISIK